jgi:hypothetical protein
MAVRAGVPDLLDGLFAALCSVAFVTMAADHRVRLIDELLAGRDALSQVLLVLLQLTRLAVAPRATLLFVCDEEYLSPR